MKKKLQDKKGFTLVELMIVVVIMGILVAVAVPVYNAVTKNVKAKACASNVRIIKENLNQYAMTGGANGGDVSAEVLAKTFTGKAWADLPQAYTNLFDEGEPLCPTDDSSYKITVTANADGSYKVDVACTAHADAAPAA